MRSSGTHEQQHEPLRLGRRNGTEYLNNLLCLVLAATGTAMDRVVNTAEDCVLFLVTVTVCRTRDKMRPGHALWSALSSRKPTKRGIPCVLNAR